MITPIPANARLSVSLEAQQWNTVLSVLAEGTFRVVQPLIQDVSGQLQEAQERYQNPNANVVQLPGQPEPDPNADREAS